MKEYNIKWYTILFIILLSLYVIYSYIKTKIIIDNNMLIYLYKGKKKEFNINLYAIKAISGDSGQELTLIDKNGKKEELDCDFLSSSQYNDLLNEIGIIGEKQQSIEIEVNRKEK